MGSSLMRKLGYLGSQRLAQPQAGTSRVRIFEWNCPAEPGLDRLHIDALSMMGFPGERFDLSRTVFLDTETTGLSGGAGTVAFLVGLGSIDRDRFTVRQYLMPDYSAEAEMLDALKRDMARFETVVHFNGRRFDIPLLAERCIMKRIDDFTRDLWQLDLLYPARSVWKLRIGSCKLTHIESEILGMPQRADIPGGEIPARYFESVRTGDTSLLSDVIDHNRQDIATLAALLVRLEALYAAPEEATEQTDIFSLGRVFERQGEYRVARHLYLKVSAPRPVTRVKDLEDCRYAGEANLRIYLIERKNGDWEKCEQTLRNMIRRGQHTDLARLELCKLYEHRLHRYREALEQCSILLEKSMEAEKEPLMKRANRIQTKLLKHGGKQNV